MLDCLASHRLFKHLAACDLVADCAPRARSARSAQACRPFTVRAGAGCSVRMSKTKSSSGDAAGLVLCGAVQKRSSLLLVSSTCSVFCRALLSLNRRGPVQGESRQLAVRRKQFLYGMPCADVA